MRRIAPFVLTTRMMFFMPVHAAIIRYVKTVGKIFN